MLQSSVAGYKANKLCAWAGGPEISAVDRTFEALWNMLRLRFPSSVAVLVFSVFT